MLPIVSGSGSNSCSLESPFEANFTQYLVAGQRFAAAKRPNLSSIPAIVLTEEDVFREDQIPDLANLIISDPRLNQTRSRA